MASFPRDALDQAITAIKGWHRLGAELFVPNVSLHEFKKKLEQAEAIAVQVEALHRERQEMVQKRNELLEELWDLTKRVRNAARATFGDTSKELEKVVGRPVRKRGRKPKARSTDE